MKKVVLQENIKMSLEREKSFLSRSDVLIFPAVTNKQALELHRNEKVDLIIANLDTPEMSGEALCSAIRDDDELRDVSIIIVSQGNEADLERCLDCRANAFVTAPINGPVLLQEAHQLLHIAPRRSFRVPLRVKLEGIKKGISFAGFVENISSSGMLIRTSAVLFEGDTVKCTLSLPSRRRIIADTEVVRLLPKEGRRAAGRYGVRFTDSGSAVPDIEGFVKAKSGDIKEGAAFLDFPVLVQKDRR